MEMRHIFIDGTQFIDALKSGKYITCHCGYKILVLPDLNLMARSIEAHLTDHSTPEPLPTNTNEVAQIEKLLMEQLFKAMQHPQP